jgi:hypothetical protein
MSKLPGVVAGLLLAVTVPAQIVPPPEAAQFDFWIGEWRVSQTDGRPAGESRIEKIAGGWGLLENWSGAGGVTGKSLNTWMPATGQWRQFWVGADGALELTGGLNAAGEMVLSGLTRTPAGGTVQERITWTPRADGTVRQRWEQSTDGGHSWTTAFDGLYRRKAG